MNRFDVLSAEKVEDRLATMASNEMPEIVIPQECEIRCEDLGDEDCRKLNFDVWIGNICVAGGFRTRGESVDWARAQGHKIISIE